MKYNICLAIGMFIASVVCKAQGPPITADKPIMLGGKSFTAKTLTEIRTTERGTSVYVPVMLHYLPTANSLIAIHIPFVRTNFITSNINFADLQLLGKYQFLRKDFTGKTFRMVAKTLQTLPTGKRLDIIGQSTKEYQAYYGIVSGYETLKYGISTEIGYNWSPNANLDEFKTKLGFGLPLLKPQYPNKQINLYFEYTSLWLHQRDWYQLLYAQGIQYALKNITFDMSIQFPLINDVSKNRQLKQSVFLGTRYTF